MLNEYAQSCERRQREQRKNEERMMTMARPGEHPEATLRDTFDHIPLVVAVLVLANVAAAAAIGRGTYNLVRRARGDRRVDEPHVASAPERAQTTLIH